MHLPNLVQISGLGVWVISWVGGYLILTFVSLSLKFGNLLKPIMGLSSNVDPQSELLVMIFQFLWITLLMFGLLGL